MIDDITILFHCNKKTIFKSSYEFDQPRLTFEGSSYSPSFIPRDTNDDDVKKIAGLEEWLIEVTVDHKKEKHQMTAFPKSADEKSMLTCIIGLKEASFNRLETNLVNNGMDFVKNIKFQISVSKKGFKKSKDSVTGWTHLDITKASLIFASKWDDWDDE
jgi:hypothetical protein